MTGSFAVTPRGPFSLERLATVRFGHQQAERFDGAMRLAFCLDGYRDQVGVEVRQHDDAVHCIVHGDPDLAAVSRQVQRILSLDHDGAQFAAVGRRDPVIGRLQALAPGLRPPLFYSPYEAAAWAIISARRSAAQMTGVRRALSDARGTRFDIAEEQVAAFPLPDQLLALTDFPGLNEQKITRLHGVARAALAGQLDAQRLRAMDPAEAMADVQSIPGIGPFYSALVVVRAVGFADVEPQDEPRSMALIARLYGLPQPLKLDEVRAVAETWRPFRTWVTFLIRAAGPGLVAELESAE
ncbi:MAG: DNA-3-methyladenine glycosylase 2 family protein [Actinomycetota bacterium]